MEHSGGGRFLWTAPQCLSHLGRVKVHVQQRLNQHAMTVACTSARPCRWEPAFLGCQHILKPPASCSVTPLLPPGSWRRSALGSVLTWLRCSAAI
jgi:hypothetical protein